MIPMSKLQHNLIRATAEERPERRLEFLVDWVLGEFLLGVDHPAEIVVFPLVSI